MAGASDVMAWPDGNARPVPTEPNRRYRDLTTRTIAGIVLGGLAIAAILLGPFGVLIMVGVAMGGLAAEWRRLIERGLPALVAVTGGIYLLLAGFSFCYIYFGPAFESSEQLAQSSLFWFGIIVVANDCFAYGVGRLVGGPKLAPRTSPKKTWSGAIGGLAGAGAAGGLAAWGFAGNSPVLLCLVAIALGVIAQAGDLAESWIKRHVGVKDTSQLIPGHGGLLDRLDGMAAAAIAVAALQAVAGAAPLDW